MIATVRVWFDRLMALGAGLSCVAMFGVVLASSTSRYSFNSPFQWSEELAKYAMIYGAMFGVAMAYNRAHHMRFTVFSDLVGRRWWVYLGGAADLAAIAVGVILVYSGWLFVQARGGVVAPGMGIRTGYAFSAMVVGGACLIVAATLDLLTRRNPDRAEVDAL
jgi:TRAP-type C4-dicarboxylate transport system permease small subunit